MHRDWFAGLAGAPFTGAIGCGRQSALVLRWLKACRGEGIRTIQILDPRINPKHFDLVISPRHDRLRGDNVLSTTGSLNPVDEDWLALGSTEFPELARYAEPRVAVLIGGPGRGFRFDRGWVGAALESLAGEVRAAGGTMLAVTTQRSPGWVGGLISGLPRSSAHYLLEWPASEAQYAAVLASATHVAVTADSVNLVSEACAVGRPVRILGSDLAHGKREMFLSALGKGGHLADENWMDAPSPQPLREADAVARRILDSGILA